MAEKTMHHAVIGADTFELVDQSARADVSDLKNALTTKAEQDGAYPDLTAGQLLSKNEASDSVPYNFRAVGHDATLEYTDAIVGGSVVWNQFCDDPTFMDESKWYTSRDMAVTISNNVAECIASSKYGGLLNHGIRSAGTLNGHVVGVLCDLKADEAYDINIVFGDNKLFTNAQPKVINTSWTNYGMLAKHAEVTMTSAYAGIRDDCGSGWKKFYVKNFMVFDLTQALGTTIADYIYTLETATEGSGVAWLRKHFPKLFTYQEYNTGEIVSVQGLSQHVTVGFNQWDEEWEVGGINTSGQETTTSGYYRSKNYISVLPNANYYFKVPTSMNVMFYDDNKGFIDCTVANNSTITTPSNCHYLRFRNSTAESWQPYNHDICINLSDPTRNGDYEPYIKRTYPLDDSLTLRGILKLDSNNQLYADGDRYLPDGTVQRRYGVRAYQSGDVTDGSTMITDGTNTVYKLTTPTTEEADPYTTPQIADPDGTEEYVSTSIVPVGHESRYPLDIAGRLDKILTMPTANGTYTLRATVNNGAVTYAWVST